MNEVDDSNDLSLQNNMLNYKGYFVENEDEDTDPKYFEFGAHFPYRELYKRLEELSRNQNKEFVRQLNVKNIVNKERNNTRNKPINMQNFLNKYDSKGKSRNNNINNVYLKNDLSYILSEHNDTLLKKDEQKNCKSISVNKDFHKNKKLNIKNTFQQIKNIKQKKNINLNLVKSFEKNHLSKNKNISAADVSSISYSKKNLSSNLKQKKLKNLRIEISGSGGSYNQGIQKNQKIFKKNYNYGKTYKYIFTKLIKKDNNKNNLNNSENKCNIKNDKIKFNHNKLSTPMKYLINKNEKSNYSNISNNKLIKKIPTNYIQYLSHKFTVIKNMKKQINTKNNVKKNIIATEISLLNDSASLEKNKNYLSNNNTFESHKNLTLNYINKSPLANYEINKKNNNNHEFLKLRNEKNSRNHNNCNLNNILSIINSTGNNFIIKTKNTVNQMNLTQFNQNKTLKYTKSVNKHLYFNEPKMNIPLINKMNKNKNKNNKTSKNNSLSFIMIKPKKIAVANKNIDNKILRYVSDKNKINSKKNEKPNININININNSNKIVYNKVVKGLNNIQPLKSHTPFNNNSINACMKKNRFKINNSKEESKIKFINIQFPKAKLLNIKRK